MAERGWFSRTRPALTMRRERYYGDDPRPAAVRGESPLIPQTELRFSGPILMGTRLWNGRGPGQREGTVE